MSKSDFLQGAKALVNKKAEVTEASIEDHFVKFAKNKGCQALKLIFLNKKGFPDRTVICPGGRVLFIEFKRKGKKLQPAQIVVKNLLTKFGFEYYVCDRIGEAETYLEFFLDSP